ncbi:MAG: polyprenol monophosphomannose synthase [Chloroflexi bacterium]|nr:polyprenol monophosphomannose synthase [Chloroflexota bacterium]
MLTYIIVPTYNEADNLPKLLREIFALSAAKRVGVIIVDDGSPDGTGAIADEWAASRPGQVVAVHRSGKLGLGTAYVAGFHRALELGATRVLTMDADFSHNPRYIPAMLARGDAPRADVVIGSRYVPGGDMLYCPWYRKILSGGANFVAHTALGLKARDATAGFRLYRREVLESIDLDSIFSSGYSFLIERLYLVQRKGWQVAEVPIVYEDRMAGQTKISRAEIFRALYTVARLSFRRFVRRR